MAIIAATQEHTMWPHIITRDARFAVWLCVGAVVNAVHPQSLLQARSTV